MTPTKIIGTFVPLSALTTRKASDSGTVAGGLLFLDWLKKTHQNAWQLLPLQQTHLIPGSKNHYVRSPYKGYGIGLNPEYTTHHTKNTPVSKATLAQFLDQEQDWLPEYALFCALRDHFQTDRWTEWDEPIRTRQKAALAYWQQTLQPQITTYITEQWRVHTDFQHLKQQAEANNITLIGDLSFYLPLQSPLTWQYQSLFRINHDGSLPRVSGVVNQAKAIYGRQLWGHPLYNWEETALHPHILTLFEKRLRFLARFFHTIRLDHANGFFLYGSLDPKDSTNDQIMPGPGHRLFESLVNTARKENIAIFAEDASVDLAKLRTAMQKLQVTGIRILRYAYDEKNELFENDYAKIAAYPPNTIAYTTTHDTAPLFTWVVSMTTEQKQHLAEKIGIQYAPTDTDESFTLALRHALINSPSQTVIIPMQDWLLSSERINVPGTENEQDDPNWQYTLSIPVEDLPDVSL